MSAIIYHNPRCSKSRQGLALLKDNGIEPEIIDYMETPPTVSDLKDLIEILGIKAHGLLRTNEKLYKQLELKDPSLSDHAIMTAINAHPLLLERPIVIIDDKAAIGRPPENILKIL